MYKLTVLVLILGISVFGWANQPQGISSSALKTEAMDKKNCDFCQQEIRSARYGGEITDQSGNTFIFRSIECLAGFAANKDINATHIRVINFIDAKKHLTVEDAIFLESRNLGSPNGMNFAALDRTNEGMLEKIERAYPGEFIEWDEVVNRVVQSGYAAKY